MFSYSCLFGAEPKKTCCPPTSNRFHSESRFIAESFLYFSCLLTKIRAIFLRAQQQGGELHQGEDNNIMTIKDKIVIEFGGSP